MANRPVSNERAIEIIRKKEHRHRPYPEVDALLTELLQDEEAKFGAYFDEKTRTLSFGAMHELSGVKPAS